MIPPKSAENAEIGGIQVFLPGLTSLSKAGGETVSGESGEAAVNELSAQDCDLTAACPDYTPFVMLTPRELCEIKLTEILSDIGTRLIKEGIMK